MEIDGSDATAPEELPPGPYVKLSVSDDGCGMDDHTMSQVFDPYFTTKEKELGTGMGLSVVQGIVKNHGGAIRVTSQPGRETKFCIWLRRIKATTCRHTAPITELPAGSERILLIDDEEALIEVGKAMLSPLGYRITATTRPEEALEWFRNEPDNFDMVITDMTMPKVSGSELAKQVLAIRADTPILLITGYSEKINRETALSLGIRDMVFKPLDTAELAQIVRKVLDS